MKLVKEINWAQHQIAANTARRLAKALRGVQLCAGSLDTLEIGRVLVSLGYSREMKFEEILAEALASFTSTCGVAMDTVGHGAKVIPRNQKFSSISFLWQIW